MTEKWTARSVRNRSPPLPSVGSLSRIGPGRTKSGRSADKGIGRRESRHHHAAPVRQTLSEPRVEVSQDHLAAPALPDHVQRPRRRWPRRPVEDAPGGQCGFETFSRVQSILESIVPSGFLFRRHHGSGRSPKQQIVMPFQTVPRQSAGKIVRAERNERGQRSGEISPEAVHQGELGHGKHVSATGPVVLQARHLILRQQSGRQQTAAGSAVQFQRARKKGFESLHLLFREFFGAGSSG